MKFNLNKTSYNTKCENCSLDYVEAQSNISGLNNMEDHEHFKPSFKNNNETQIVKVICSWCQKYMGQKEFKANESDNLPDITHSICEKCIEQELEKLGE